MGPIRLDPLGWMDILVGAMLLFTSSPVPDNIAMAHALFLLFKGSGSVLRPFRFPMPVFVLGAFADVMSAGILYFGNPPILATYTTQISFLLLLKGLWSFMGLLRL